MSRSTACLGVFVRWVEAIQASRLIRREVEKLIVGYTFDLNRNVLSPETVDNPSAGREHVFSAYRLKKAPGDEVFMRETILEPQAASSHESDDE